MQEAAKSGNDVSGEKAQTSPERHGKDHGFMENPITPPPPHMILDRRTTPENCRMLHWSSANVLLVNAINLH